MSTTRVTVTPTELIVEPRGLDKLWSFRRRIVVPLSHVRGATHDPGMKHEPRGLRAPGLGLPSKLAGTFRRDGERHFRPMRAAGCQACRMTGYRGRSGLFELLTFDEGVRHAISERPDLARLRRESLRQGLTPLRLAGLHKVAQGLTTLDEVLRSTPDYST